MRLLFDGRAVQSSIRSGVPRVASLWLSELVREGHEVTVFTTGWKPFVLEIAGVQHVHLRVPNKLLHAVLFAVSRPFLDTLITRRTGVTYDAVVVPNVHFFASRVPYWLLVHDLSFLIAPNYFSRFEQFVHAVKRPMRMIRGAARVFAVSRSTARDVTRLCGRKDVEVLDIRGIVPGASGAGAANIINKQERRDIVFISTTEKRKNLESAILGFLGWKRALGKSEEKFLIIGAITREGRSIKQRFAGERDIVWLGSVDDVTRTFLLGRARALLYPSFFEGFGIPLLEAQALGTPVITSFATSMPEVAPGAILIDPTRPETITQALFLLE